MTHDPRPQPTDLAALRAGIALPYWNEAVAAVNDHEIRMSVMTAPFDWHVHPHSDESFLVLEGALILTLEDAEIVLAPGQMVTVPHGTLHKTRPAGARSVNLTFERTAAATEFVTPPANPLPLAGEVG